MGDFSRSRNSKFTGIIKLKLTYLVPVFISSLLSQFQRAPLYITLPVGKMYAYRLVSDSASEVFQNAIENALGGLDGVRNIADDIILWGSTEHEHDERLDALFSRLADKGLTVNPDKCLFNQESLWFYGYHLTKDGLRADPSKIAAINNTRVPENAAERRSLLGLSN